MDTPIRAVEFFAGIGLVREALEPLGVDMVWANDIALTKFGLYQLNHRDAEERFVVGDIRDVRGDSLPEGIELATSSFPCTDLSLAGRRGGLAGAQSGMFWQFARVLQEMPARPPVVLLENVPSFATSNEGQDLIAALRRLSELGYSLDLLVVDARHFVPQSRPRLFIVGVQSAALPAEARCGVPECSDVRPPWLAAVFERLAGELAMHHLDLPPLPHGPDDLAGVVEDLDDNDPRWWSADRVADFVAALGEAQRARFEALQFDEALSCRTACRRTRGGRVVWELRSDGLAGCLRAKRGGSNGQVLVKLGRGRAPQVRWLTPVDEARLMGAGSYRLVGSTTNFGFGDAVVVDVVRWIGQHYLMPVLRGGAR